MGRDFTASVNEAERDSGRITVREYFERQREDYSGCAWFGPGCAIVESRGFFLVATVRFVEIVAPDADLADVSEMAETLFGDEDWRNDSFGSRLRAPVTSNDGWRWWTFQEILRGRSPREVATELMAAGVHERGANTLVAVGLWLRENPNRMPTQNDLEPILNRLD